MIYHLPERCLIKISGEDAEAFLQSLVTQDMSGLEAFTSPLGEGGAHALAWEGEGTPFSESPATSPKYPHLPADSGGPLPLPKERKSNLIYACLLTPQGRFLHDFFISREEGAFFLECEIERREDLLRRLKVFKLRSKVMIEDCSAAFAVYTGMTGKYRDPRLAALGYRSYLPVGEITEAASAVAYKDHRIHLGVPEGSIDIKPEVDTLADANLDKLHAVSWDKGCFVGQEVAARMENRALVKKRMVIVSGSGLAAGASLNQNDSAVGEIRSVNTTQTEGLAILKLAALQESSPITQPDGAVIEAHLPAWLKI